MSTVQKLHQQAIDLAEQADLAKLRGLKDLFMQINLRNYLNRQGVKLTEAQLQRLAGTHHALTYYQRRHHSQPRY
jgi:predicted transcriptional regulator